MMLYVRNTSSEENCMVKISSFCLEEFRFIREESTKNDVARILGFCKNELRSRSELD